MERGYQIAAHQVPAQGTEAIPVAAESTGPELLEGYTIKFHIRTSEVSMRTWYILI
jgi:hypothetical protein